MCVVSANTQTSARAQVRLVCGDTNALLRGISTKLQQAFHHRCVALCRSEVQGCRAPRLLMDGTTCVRHAINPNPPK